MGFYVVVSDLHPCRAIGGGVTRAEALVGFSGETCHAIEASEALYVLATTIEDDGILHLEAPLYTVTDDGLAVPAEQLARIHWRNEDERRGGESLILVPVGGGPSRCVDVYVGDSV